MSFVYLDTHILIWGIKKESTAGQEQMIQRAQHFLKWLEENAIKVAIPSVVLGELLLRVPIDQHAEVYANVAEHSFIVHPYDALAAVKAAQVWILARNSGLVDDMLLDSGVTRASIRADCQIIGIALSRHGGTIYSHDAGLKRLAKGHIPVREMPELPSKQASLFSPN